MKRHVVIISAALVMLWGATAAVVDAADQSAPATSGVATVEPPNAMISDQKYEFDKVVDGTEVTHDFTIKNTGKGELEISRVKTG